MARRNLHVKRWQQGLVHALAKRHDGNAMCSWLKVLVLSSVEAKAKQRLTGVARRFAVDVDVHIRLAPDALADAQAGLRGVVGHLSWRTCCYSRGRSYRCGGGGNRYLGRGEGR